MKHKRLFLDIHALQSVPPSNLNRDDTGSPKTAIYGGAVRARVSSQSWKRAMRSYFYENSEKEQLGIRTLEVPKYVAHKICQIDETIEEKEALKMAEKVIKGAGLSLTQNKTRALFFIGDKQAHNLAQAALEGESDKKALKEILKGKSAIDVSLFGRMVADDPSLNVDASSQIAHAISTHAVQTEFDFFTAVDDLAPEDNQGAGMLGTVEYNSSTLYRYGNVAVHEFYQQLGDKETTLNALKLFIESFIFSLPTGKVNTFANQTLPQFIMVVLREDRPVNLVSAFEEPVRSTDGMVEKSIKQFIKESEQSERFVEKPLAAFYLSTKDLKSVSESEQMNNMSDLLEHLTFVLDARFKG